jgi:hypothetical protein
MKNQLLLFYFESIQKYFVWKKDKIPCCSENIFNLSLFVVIGSTINAEACMLHWQIGKRIKEDVLFNKRAEYGKQIIKNLAVALAEKYGKGWGYEKLKHCVRSAYTFSEDEIRYAVSTQLTWTHLRSLMSINDELKR